MTKTIIRLWYRAVYLCLVTVFAVLVRVCWAEASLSADDSSRVIAVVVGSSSPIQTLSARQVQKIFMGKLRLYPNSGPEVVAYDLEDDHFTKDQFYVSLVSMHPSKLAKYRASYLFSGKGRLPEELDSVEDLSEKLQVDPGGIGYMRADQLTEQVRVIYQFSVP